MTQLKKRYIVNFPRHMADCEFNYRRLRRLMPGWRLNQEPMATDKDNDWHYIIGRHKQEMAISINVRDSAKYTTTVHIAVYSRLQNQVAWGKYTHCDCKKLILKGVDKDFTMADSAISAKLFSNHCKTYSLDVRLYHDATVAEVIAWQGHRRFQPRHDYPNPKMYQRDEKAQLNQFLGELLEFCLVEGRVRQVMGYP